MQVTWSMSQAAQFEQGGTSRCTGGDDDEDEEEESTSSAMQISSSRGIPPPRPSRTQSAQFSFSSTRDKKYRDL